MNGVIIGALMALSMVQQTDTTFAVGGAELLDVESLGGSINVTTWNEDMIRIQAEHSQRTFVEIDRGRRSISVESEARRGPANLVDYEITVPRSLGLRLEAQYGDNPYHNRKHAADVVLGVHRFLSETRPNTSAGHDDGIGGEDGGSDGIGGCADQVGGSSNSSLIFGEIIYIHLIVAIGFPKKPGVIINL